LSVASLERPEPFVLIAMATSAERSCLARMTRVGNHARLVQTGPGSAAEVGLSRAAPIDGVAGLMSAGTAAGLKPTLKPGTILLPERVAADGDREFAVHPQWHAQLYEALSALGEIETGLLVSVANVLTNPAAKQRLHARTGASAADMESAALAAAARGRKIPFVVLRVVMDAAQDRVPGAAAAGLGADGSLQPLAMLRALAGRPSDLGLLITSSVRFFSASVALGRAFGAVAAQLLPPDSMRR
jgi:hypothetical protein